MRVLTGLPSSVKNFAQKPNMDQIPLLPSASSNTRRKQPYKPKLQTKKDRENSRSLGLILSYAISKFSMWTLLDLIPVYTLLLAIPSLTKFFSIALSIGSGPHTKKNMSL